MRCEHLFTTLAVTIIPVGPEGEPPPRESTFQVLLESLWWANRKTRERRRRRRRRDVVIVNKY